MEKKQVKFIHGFISILALAVVMFGATVLFEATPHLPLIIGCVVAGIVAATRGFKWEEILESMLDGIFQSLEAVIILMCIGILISTWIASGTVPALIYYGLKILSPKIFLVATFVICSLISMVMGAWGAAGSMGLAFMGIGQAIGMPMPMVAGAIISGVYVGEQLSPFSDGVNLSASVANVGVFPMIKKMLKTTGAVYIATAVVYTVIGFMIPVENGDAITENIAPLLADLTANFKINPLAMLPLAAMLICIFLKMPSIPAILCGAAVAAIQAVLMQGVQVVDIFAYVTEGFVCTIENDVLKELLTAGGTGAMMETISVILIAMAFGGIMRGTGQMEAVVAPIVRKIRSVGGFVALTIGSCIGVNVVLPDQYLGIMVPGQMYAEEYDRRGIDRLYLGNILGAGAAVTSALIPWNTCGMYMYSILGVGAFEYLPYAVFNYSLPIIFIIYFALFGKKKMAA